MAPKQTKIIFQQSFQHLTPPSPIMAPKQTKNSKELQTKLTGAHEKPEYSKERVRKQSLLQLSNQETRIQVRSHQPIQQRKLISKRQAS
jgi:hypothetical protein